MKYAAAYLAVAGTFLVLDLVWLGYVANGLYRSEMGSLMVEKINLTAAICFYFVYTLGIVVLAVDPALDQESAARALMLGAVLGFVGYATYDLTGLAVINGFPLRLALMDLAWGTTITAVAASAGYFAARAV